MKDYKIAGHRLSIDFFDNGINEKLLPNLGPFAYDGSEPSAITLRIVTDYEWAQEVHEVGTFDVGGSNYGVFRTSDGGERIFAEKTSDNESVGKIVTLLAHIGEQ